MGSPAIKLKDYLRMTVYTKNIEKLVKRVEELEKKINEKQ
jgi:UDP-3-O-[3-hydroxymyristoyl] glucosamine N-acyltransferase